MFMRAVLPEEVRVGLLLFDEPSAALDPTAEHGTRTISQIQPFLTIDIIRLDVR
jgi:ABC-type arginine transport system ATPase subunit